MYLIKHKTTIHATLTALKDSLAPSTVDYEYQIQRKYQAARSFDKHQNFEEWSRRFQQAYDQAASVNLPEISGYRAQKDLLRAINIVDSAYTVVVNIQLLRVEQNSATPPHHYSVASMIAEFLRHYRTVHSSFSQSNYSVFTATLNGEEQPTPPKKNKPCLCGDQHPWGKCPYIVKSLQNRPGFTFEQAKQDLVDQKTAQNSQLAGVMAKVVQREARRDANRSKKLTTRTDGQKQTSRHQSPEILNLDTAPKDGRL